jgi:hypothetical protein
MAQKILTQPSGFGTVQRSLAGSATPARSPSPSPRRTDKKILAILGVFLSVGWMSLVQGPGSRAQAADPPKSPEYDGQLILECNLKGCTSTEELDQDKIKEIPFSGENLYFFYGVKRDKKGDRKPGAIIVKVTYLYDSGKEDIVEWAKDTELYRSAFPDRNTILDSAIRRPYYENYHKGDKDNLFLIHNFHSIFRDKEKTDGNYQRKRKFLFSSEPQWNPEIRRQRTFLLYYSGVDDLGTWIPFDVGITSKMCDLLISVIDIGQPSADLVERWWHISKKKVME